MADDENQEDVVLETAAMRRLGEVPEDTAQGHAIQSRNDDDWNETDYRMWAVERAMDYGGDGVHGLIETAKAILDFVHGQPLEPPELSPEWFDRATLRQARDAA